MRLLFQLPEQILTHFSKRAFAVKPKEQKLNQGKSTIYR